MNTFKIGDVVKVKRDKEGKLFWGADNSFIGMIFLIKSIRLQSSYKPESFVVIDTATLDEYILFANELEKLVE